MGSMTVSVEPRRTSDPAISVTIVSGQTIEAKGSMTATGISASWASPQGAMIDLTVNRADGSATLLGRNGADVQTFEGRCETVDP
jgi:hypothetical protein